MRLNKNPKLLTVGMKVTSDYHESEHTVIRTLTSLIIDKSYGSGVKASSDGGETCSCCGKTLGTPIENLDSAWFLELK